MTTTAEYRKKAWVEKEKRNYKEAARLYDLAIKKYPSSFVQLSQFAKADIDGLRKLKKEMESMTHA